MGLRSKKKMASPVTAAASSSGSLGTRADPVRHEIVQRSPAISKFGGRIGTQCPDVETFLESVDNYLNTLTNPTDRDKLNEAKSFLDLNKGDLKNFCASWEFKNLASWDELKSYLRSVYGAVSRKDAVVSLSKVIREQEKSNSHYLDFAGDAYIKLNAWKQLLETSDWVNRSTKTISIDNLASLLHLGFTLKHLPEALVDNIKEKWEPTDGLRVLKKRVEENLSKTPDMDLSRVVIKAQPSNKTSVSVVNKGQKTGQQNQSQSNQKAKNRFTGKPRVCFNCQKPNHHQKDCTARPYCSHHERQGHRTDECIALKAQRQDRNGPQNQNRYPHTGQDRNVSPHTQNRYHHQNRTQNSQQSAHSSSHQHQSSNDQNNASYQAQSSSNRNRYGNNHSSANNHEPRNYHQNRRRVNNVTENPSYDEFPPPPTSVQLTNFRESPGSTSRET